MSTLFTVFCETCGVAGPHIRRHHNGALLMEERSARFFPNSATDRASRDWGGFLIEHEYCDLTLRYEYARSLAIAEQRRKRQLEWEEATRPTHRLLPDGSLEPQDV